MVDPCRLLVFGQQAPPEGPVTWVALLVALAAGLVIWVFGRRMIRLSVTLCGVALGLFLAIMIGGAFLKGGVLLTVIASAMLVGGMAAGLLFRVWITITTALLLAVALPIGHLAWHGDSTVLTHAIDTSTGSVEEAMDDTDTLEQYMESFRAYAQRRIQWGRDWWEGQEVTARRALYGVAAVGLIAGLIGGLIAPNCCAMFQTSLFGGLLMLGVVRQSLMILKPEADQWAAMGPRPHIIAVCLITMLGMLLQWTYRKRQTDK